MRFPKRWRERSHCIPSHNPALPAKLTVAEVEPLFQIFK